MTTSNMTGVLPGEKAVDDNLIREVVNELNEAYHQGSVSTMQTVGRILLAKMFADDMAEFATRADKHKSFKALAKSKDLKFSSSHLWYAVALQSPEKIFGAAHGQISASIQRRLVHVPEESKRLELAQRAANENLAVRAVEQLIKETRTKKDDRGRPELPEAVKRFNKIFGVASKLHGLAIGESATIKAATAADILANVQALRIALDGWLPQFEADLVRRVQAGQMPSV